MLTATRQSMPFSVTPSPPSEPVRIPKLSVRNKSEDITPVDDDITSAAQFPRRATVSGGADTQDVGNAPGGSGVDPPFSSPPSRAGQVESSPTTPTREFKSKKSGVMSFFTLKEPSTAAWDQFAAEQRKQQASKGPISTPVSAVPNKKLPEFVPKVNSKWDGMPNVARKQGLASWKNSMDGGSSTRGGRASQSSGSSGRKSKEKSPWTSKTHSKNNSTAGATEQSGVSRPTTANTLLNGTPGSQSGSAGSNTPRSIPLINSTRIQEPASTDITDRTPSLQTPQLQTPEPRPSSQLDYFGTPSSQTSTIPESQSYNFSEPPDIQRDQLGRRRPPAATAESVQAPGRELRFNAFDDTPPSPESPRTPVDATLSGFGPPGSKNVVANYSRYPRAPTPEEEAILGSFGPDSIPPPVPPKSERRNSLTMPEEGSPIADPGFVFDFDQAKGGSTPSSPNSRNTSALRQPAADMTFGPPLRSQLRPPRMQPGRVVVKDSDLATIPESDTASILLKPGMQPSPYHDDYNESDDNDTDTEQQDIETYRPETRDSQADDNYSIAESTASDISAQWYQSPQERLGLGGRLTRDVAGEPWPLPLDMNQNDDDDDNFIFTEETPSVGGSGGAHDKSKARNSLMGVFKKS